MKFRYARKEETPALLPAMFDLLYENMRCIIPDGRPKEVQRAEWLAQAGPALSGEKRRLCLMEQSGGLRGFFWYYIKDGTLMMEEIQLRKEHRGTGHFRGFFVWLIKKLPKDIDRAEAYAHRENRKSQSILEYLGLRAVPETFGNEYILYRGSYSLMAERINQKERGNG